MSSKREVIAVLLLWATALVISGIAPADRVTWLLEVAPVIIAAPLIWIVHHRAPLTRVLLWAAMGHGLILMLGAHYTYAEVPLGFWAQEMFGFSRNHYDRLGHLAQGFVPALLTREVLLRTTPIPRGWMLFFLCACVPLAFSAFYEMIEWWAAVILDQGADAFLGTQGDPWDTQWDMFMALLGAVLAQLILAKLHDQQLARRA